MFQYYSKFQSLLQISIERILLFSSRRFSKSKITDPDKNESNFQNRIFNIELSRTRFNSNILLRQLSDPTEKRNASNTYETMLLYTHTYAIAGMVCGHRWLLRSIDRAQQLVPWPDLVWTLHSALCLALTQSPLLPLSLYSSPPPPHRPPIIPPCLGTAVVSSTLHSHTISTTSPPCKKPPSLPLSTQY